MFGKPCVFIIGYYQGNNWGDVKSLELLKKSIEGFYPQAEMVTSNPSALFSDLLKIVSATAVVFGNGNIFQSQSSKRSFYYYLLLAFWVKILRKPLVCLSQGIGPLSRWESFLLSLVMFQVPWVSRDGSAPRWVRKILGADWIEQDVPKILYDPKSSSESWIGISQAQPDFLRKTSLKFLKTDRFHGALVASRNAIPFSENLSPEKWIGYRKFHENRSSRSLQRLALRNQKILRWLLRFQPVEEIPQSGVLMSFNASVFYYLPKNRVSKMIGIVDGISVKILPRFWGVARLRGVDVVKKLLEQRAVVWGTRREILNKLHDFKLTTFSGFEDEENQEQTYKSVVAMNPSIVILAMGSPRQEMLAFKLSEQLPRALIVPAGGSVDAIVGDAPLVPRFVHKLGLEWLVRMVCQPHRFSRIPLIIKGIWKSWFMTS